MIDNASPDDTAPRAEAIDGVEVVRNATNVGYAAAMNQAFGADDARRTCSRSTPTASSATGTSTPASPRSKPTPQLAAVTGVLRLADGRIDSTGIDPRRARYRAPRPRPPHGRAVGRRAVRCVGRRRGVAPRARSTPFGPKPWWDWLFVYWDDVELAWRLRDHGWRFVCVVDASATHRARGATPPSPTSSRRSRCATGSRPSRATKAAPGCSARARAAFTAFTLARLALRHPQRVAPRRARCRPLRAGLSQHVQ